MDNIIIEELQVYAHHGVAEEEKAMGQMFLISLQIGVNMGRVAAVDSIDAVLSYAVICDDVQKVMQSENYNLIETAAMHIIEYLFRTYADVLEVRIILKKPWAPMGHHLKYAAVELVRRRGDRNEW